MIRVSSPNGDAYYINPHQIKLIEARPDTIITMLDGEIVRVEDAVETLVKAIHQYEREIYGGLPSSRLEGR